MTPAPNPPPAEVYVRDVDNQVVSLPTVHGLRLEFEQWSDQKIGQITKWGAVAVVAGIIGAAGSYYSAMNRIQMLETKQLAAPTVRGLDSLRSDFKAQSAKLDEVLDLLKDRKAP